MDNLIAILSKEYYESFFHKTKRGWKWMAVGREMVDFCSPIGYGDTIELAQQDLKRIINEYEVERQERFKNGKN